MLKKNYDHLQANAFIGSLLYSYADKETASKLYKVLINLPQEKEAN